MSDNTAKMARSTDSRCIFNAFRALCSECKKNVYFHMIVWTTDIFTMEVDAMDPETVTKVDAVLMLKGRRFCGCCGTAVTLADGIPFTDFQAANEIRRLLKQYTDSRTIMYSVKDALPFGLIFKQGGNVISAVCPKCGIYSRKIPLVSVYTRKHEDGTLKGHFVTGKACADCGHVPMIAIDVRDLDFDSPYNSIRSQLVSGVATKTLHGTETVEWHLNEFNKSLHKDIHEAPPPQKYPEAPHHTLAVRGGDCLAWEEDEADNTQQWALGRGSINTDTYTKAPIVTYQKIMIQTMNMVTK